MAYIDIIKQLLESAQKGQAINEKEMVTAVRAVNLDIQNKPAPVTCLICGKSRGPYSVGEHGIIYATHITFPNGEIMSGAEGSYAFFIDKDCWPLIHLSSILYTKNPEVLDDEDDNEKS